VPAEIVQFQIDAIFLITSYSWVGVSYPLS
jgi:hypothetical protein